MQYRIYPPRLEDHEVYFRLNAFTAPEIFVDGVKAERGSEANQFILPREKGNDVIARLEPRRYGLDIPYMYIGKEEVFIAEPFTWWQLIWMALPICLVFVGGLLGGFAGTIAFMFNARLLRLDINPYLKILFSILIVVGSFFFYLSLAVLVQDWFG